MPRTIRKLFAHIEANLFCLWRGLWHGEVWQVVTGAFSCPDQCENSHSINIVGAMSRQGEDIKSELFYRWEEGGKHVEKKSH